MNKIIKLLLIGVIAVAFLNFSSVNAEKYSSAPTLYKMTGPSASSYEGFQALTVSVTTAYLEEVGYDANKIDLIVLKKRLNDQIYIPIQGTSALNKWRQDLAYFENGKLIVGCGNKPFAEYEIKNICIEDTNSPVFSLEENIDGNWTSPDGKAKNKNIKIKLHASDIGTGLNNSRVKYSWKSKEDCKSASNTNIFTDGKELIISVDGIYKLYLCGEDKSNECSTTNTGEYEATFILDTEKGECKELTLPTNWLNRGFEIIANLADVTNIYSYNGAVCGYKCDEDNGYELDRKGTETNSDDTCEKVEDFSCDENTLPEIYTNKITKPTSKNQTYIKDNLECGYTIPPIDKNCDLSTKPSATFMNFSGENDSTIGTIGYTYGASICGYTCKSGHLDNKGTEITSDDKCKNGPPSCTNPGKPAAFTESTMNYNSNDCSYSCKETNKNYNTHGTLTISDDTCDGTGGNSCNSSTEPTNTNFMTIIKNPTLINQGFEFESEKCGYICETGYKLNTNNTTTTKDDICEYNTSRCTAGVITDVCSCSLDMNKNLSICGPETLPGEIGIIDKNLLADTYKYRVIIPVGEDESRIAYIKYRIELEDGNMSNIRTSTTLNFNWNMRDVDSAILSDGSREYTFNLIEICDEAGNCRDVDKDYIHKVYSNTTEWNLGQTIENIPKNRKSTIIDNIGIADGIPNISRIKLLGKYGNQVVPAIGINRTIDFNFNTINTLNQDQYTNQRNAVYLSEANKSDYANRIILSNSETLNQLNNQISSNGEYKFGFKIYAPTNNDNKFEIKDLNLDINGELGNIQNFSLTSNKIFNFTPLYETKFSSDFDELKSNFTQTGTIDLVKEPSGNVTLISNKNIFLTKDATSSDKKYSFDFKYTISGNILSTLFNFIDRGNNYLSDFKTVFIQSGIKYINDGKNITYKSTKVGGDNDIINGVKILGKTNINENSQRDILENQDSEDVHNLAGKINKASLKRNIKRNAFKLTRGMSDGQTLNGIKFLECTSGEKKTLSVYNGTYILKGCNALINSNVTFGGLIVLKNSNGNGGMLYIDPSVTKIEAAIYVDKSIVSYKSGVELSSYSNYDLLINQLYIYGAVFSENTIGGSLKSEPVCPYYVASCTKEDAQKYDLNFLRSGYENKSESNLGDYPVIIKYNPSIQTNPPAGFSE